MHTLTTSAYTSVCKNGPACIMGHVALPSYNTALTPINRVIVHYLTTHVCLPPPRACTVCKQADEGAVPGDSPHSIDQVTHTNQTIDPHNIHTQHTQSL